MSRYCVAPQVVDGVLSYVYVKEPLCKNCLAGFGLYIIYTLKYRNRVSRVIARDETKTSRLYRRS